MLTIKREFQKGKMFEIFVDSQSRVGAIIVFFARNKQDEKKVDLAVTHVNCGDNEI